MPTTTTARTDVHSPSNMLPEDYEFVGDIFMGRGYHWDDGVDWWEEPPYADVPDDYDTSTMFQGHFVAHQGCDHCGAPKLTYAEVFKHLPTGKYVTVGLDCSHRFTHESRTAWEMEKKKERLRITSIRNRFAQREPNLYQWLTNVENVDGDEFYGSLAGRIQKYGELTPRQIIAAHDSIQRLISRTWSRLWEKEDETKEPVPVTDERVEVVGEVVSVKIKESEYYGDRLVMTVKDDRGFLVWGTVPSAIDDVERGDRISFAARLEVSDTDETFGFFKRPSKATIL